MWSAAASEARRRFGCRWHFCCISGFHFDAQSLRTVPRGREYCHKLGTTGLHSAFEFQGVLVVTDAAAFRTILQCGIGSAKAFGFGLLVIAPL